MEIYAYHNEKGNLFHEERVFIIVCQLVHYNMSCFCGMCFVCKAVKDVIYGRYLSNKFVVIQK